MSEEGLFEEALRLAPAEREAYLARAIGDPALRLRVRELLAAHAAAAGPLEGEAPKPTGATEDFQPNAGAGAVIAGRYRLLERLGEGGMGEVWVAKQDQPVKRKVALKLIKPGMDSRAVLARFDQERQALAMMDHPNIARAVDAGLTADARPFFVMELVNGAPLTTFCDQAKLTPRERLELFVPICQAVQHAHQKGVVHRDLKPSNILVTLYDGRPVPKIIDFGVAKALGGKLTEETLSTQFGAVVGTLEYMAPEQAGLSALDVDTRADIYSLGVILYELLTGLKPFDGQRLRKAAFDEVLRILREEEPPRPSTRLSSDHALPSLAAVRRTEPKRLAALMRGELDCIVMKALEKDRSRRYETANALGRDVQRHLADEPVEARPPSLSYRLSKLVRRNKGKALALAAVLLALVAGIVGTSWGLFRALAAEDEMRRERDEKGTALAKEKEQRERAEKADALNHVDQALAVLRNDQRLGILHLAHVLPKIPGHAKELRQFVTMAILANGQLLRPLVGDGEAWDTLYLAPNGNLLGRKASAADVEEVGLWEPLTGKQLARFPLDQLGTGISTSPNGRYAALLGMDLATVLIVDANTGAVVHQVRTDFGQINHVVISNDGRTFATLAWRPGELLVWRTGREKPQRLPRLRAFALSPDGETCLTVQRGDALEARSTATGALLHRFTEIPAPVEDVEFSPSGRTACAWKGDWLHWIDVEGWQVDRRAVPHGVASEKPRIRFLADDVALVASSTVMKRGGGIVRLDTGMASSVDASVQGGFVLSETGQLLDLASGSNVHPRDGLRIPQELKRFATGRFVIQGEIPDLATERPMLPKGHWAGAGVETNHRLLPNGILLLRQGNSLILLPTPDQEIDPQALALWAKVVACGEMNAVGGCDEWTEAKWDAQRAALARLPRQGELPFPGGVVYDAAHFIRVKVEVMMGPTVEQATRLLARAPNWRSHDEGYSERLADRLRFQLEAARLSSPRYWRRADNDGHAWRLACDRNAARADQEVALRWCEERERAGVFDKEPTRELLLLRLDQPDEAVRLMRKRLARMECVVACGLAMAPWPMKRLNGEDSFDRPVRAMAFHRGGDVQAAKDWLQAAQALKAREARNEAYAQLLAEATALIEGGPAK